MYIHAAPDKSTISRYETLKQVEKSTGKTPRELETGPSLPELMTEAWEAYLALSSYTYQEIESYIRLTGHELAPWEVQAIMKLAKFREVTPRWPI